MRQTADQTDRLIYTEKLISNKTEAFFLSLTFFFFLMAVWRVSLRGLDILAVVFWVFFGFFFFYSVNYRTLIIRLSSKSLILTFGIFSWMVPWGNVAEYCLDDLPVLMRMGGAGIHFMTIRKRYRVSFNFLEYPRVLITLRRKAGLVRDISFSTRQPQDVLKGIQEALSVDWQAQPGNSSGLDFTPSHTNG